VKVRLGQVVLLAACTAIGPLSLNIYLPSLPFVQQAFGADVASVQLSISLALLGFGLGLAVLGPLSDRFGRRPCLIGGLLLFAAGSLLAALAPNLWLLVAGRFALAVGASITFISARAVVADISPREDLPRSVAQVTVINVITQSTAPLIGNAVIALGGWRATQGLGAVVGVSLAAVVYLRQAETLQMTATAVVARTWRNFLLPTLQLLRTPGFGRVMLQVALLYCAYPAFVSTAPHLMVEAYARPATDFAYYFAFLPLGYLLGNLFVLQFGRHFREGQLIPVGTAVAVLSCVASLLLNWLGVRHPLSMFVPAGLLLNFGLGLALPAVSARAVLSAGSNVGSAWGLTGFSQQALSALAVQSLGYFSAASVYPVLYVCLAAATLALLLEILWNPPPR
jgi:DHA1 family bicyclomycin/chloramphenicol resistance-like MFS transporter